MIGASIRRIVDPRLLCGKGSYVDDISLPGILHAALVRSPHGHARIKRIDLAAVKAAPGVVDAFTLTDGWEEPPIIPVLVGVPSLLPCYQYPLARDKVRYVGEPVAIVVAIDRAHADEAAELAKVEYEPLPVIADCDAARTASAQLLHDTVPGNIAARWTDEIGNVARAFASADRVVHECFRMQRYTGVPMETPGVLAMTEWVAGDLTIWASGQWPHTARSLTAALLRLDEQRVRVIQPDVGGGFGVE